MNADMDAAEYVSALAAKLDRLTLRAAAALTAHARVVRPDAVRYVHLDGETVIARVSSRAGQCLMNGCPVTQTGRQGPDAVTDGQWLLSVPGAWTTDRAGR